MLLIFTDLWSPFLIRVIPACYPQAIARQTGLFRQLTQPFPHAPLIRTMIQRIVTVIHRSVVIRLNQWYQCYHHPSPNSLATDSYSILCFRIQ